MVGHVFLFLCFTAGWGVHNGFSCAWLLGCLLIRDHVLCFTWAEHVLRISLLCGFLVVEYFNSLFFFFLSISFAQNQSKSSKGTMLALVSFPTKAG